MGNPKLRAMSEMKARAIFRGTLTTDKETAEAYRRWCKEWGDRVMTFNAPRCRGFERGERRTNMN